MADTHSISNGSPDTPLPLLLGNRVCLDFVNSVDPRKGDPKECLHSYTNLVGWGAYASLLSSAEAEALSVRAARHQDEAEGVFRRGIDLRETLYHLFYAVSQGDAPPKREAATLQQAYIDALPHARMTQTAIGFDWVWPGDALETPLWRLTHDAVELLRTGELARLKECASPIMCGWLFYDTSKNNSRRWCSMAECGVPEKVRQQRRRRAKASNAKG